MTHPPLSCQQQTRTDRACANKMPRAIPSYSPLVDESPFALTKARHRMPDDWSDDELAAEVEAYVAMTRREAAGTPYSKRQIYRDLVERYGRTENAFEYRMRNISAVLDEMGKEWIPGLP